MHRVGNRLLSLPPSPNAPCRCGDKCNCHNEAAHWSGSPHMPVSTTALLLMLMSEKGGFSCMVNMLQEICPFLPASEQEGILKMLDLRCEAYRLKSTLDVKASICRSKGCCALTRHERNAGLVRTLSRYAAPGAKPVLGSMEKALATGYALESGMRCFRDSSKDPMEMIQAMSGFMPKGAMPDMSKVANMMKMVGMFNAMSSQENIKN